MQNPVPAIRAEFLKRVGLGTRDRQPNQEIFLAQLSYYAAQHPEAFNVSLDLHMVWKAEKSKVHIVLYLSAVSFERWEDGTMYPFFDQLTNVLLPGMRAYLPPWGNFSSCMMPFALQKDASRYHLAYLSTIDCAEYEPDEVIELALASYEGGKEAVVYLKTVAEALNRGERKLDVTKHLAGMKRLIAEQEKKFAAKKSSIRSH